MIVETEVQEGKEVVVLKPPQPEVVYVPQYDPQTAYAPAPAAARGGPLQLRRLRRRDRQGHSTGSMIATGRAGVWRGHSRQRSCCDDDDDNHHTTTTTRTTAMAACPTTRRIPTGRRTVTATTPATGTTGRRTTTAASRTPATSTSIPGTRASGNNYWDRYDSKRAPGKQRWRHLQPRTAGQSPITAARPNRAELNELSKRQPRPMPANVKRPSQTATAANWKGQSGYAGKANKSGSARSAEDRIAQATPAYSRPASGKAARLPGNPSRKYKAATPVPGTTPVSRQ